MLEISQCHHMSSRLNVNHKHQCTSRIINKHQQQRSLIQPLTIKMRETLRRPIAKPKRLVWSSRNPLNQTPKLSQRIFELLPEKNTTNIFKRKIGFGSSQLQSFCSSEFDLEGLAINEVNITRTVEHGEIISVSITLYLLQGVTARINTNGTYTVCIVKTLSKCVSVLEKSNKANNA